MTATQALIPNLVPKKHLLNAIAMNQVSLQGARLVGPGLDRSSLVARRTWRRIRSVHFPLHHWRRRRYRRPNPILRRTDQGVQHGFEPLGGDTIHLGRFAAQSHLRPHGVALCDDDVLRVDVARSRARRFWRRRNERQLSHDGRRCRCTVRRVFNRRDSEQLRTRGVVTHNGRTSVDWRCSSWPYPATS